MLQLLLTRNGQDILTSGYHHNKHILTDGTSKELITNGKKRTGRVTTVSIVLNVIKKVVNQLLYHGLNVAPIIQIRQTKNV